MPSQRGGQQTLGGTNIDWTGGANLTTMTGYVTGARSIKCFWPLDFRNARAIKNDLQEGLKEEMLLKPPEDIEKEGAQAITLTTWLNKIMKALEDCGMDTVFYLPNPQANREIYMLTYWGLINNDELQEWISMLTTQGG